MSSGSAPATGSRPPRRKRFRARPIGYHPPMGIRFVSLFVVASLFAIGASCASDDDGQRSVQHHRTCGVGRARRAAGERPDGQRDHGRDRRPGAGAGRVPGRRERRPVYVDDDTAFTPADASGDLEKVRGDTVQVTGSLTKDGDTCTPVAECGRPLRTRAAITRRRHRGLDGRRRCRRRDEQPAPRDARPPARRRRPTIRTTKARSPTPRRPRAPARTTLTTTASWTTTTTAGRAS